MKKKKEEAKAEFKLPLVPNQKQLFAVTRPLLTLADSLKVRNDQEFTGSWPLVGRIDRAILTVGETFDPFVQGLYRMHKMAVKLRAQFLEPLEAAKRHILEERQSYREEQEEAKQKEAQRAAELLQKEQQKELEREAKKLERRGDAEGASVFREQAATVPLPAILPEAAVPETEGSVVRKRWIFEIVDPLKVQRQYCSPDPTLIRPLVQSLGPACGIEGIVVTEERKEHSRG